MLSTLALAALLLHSSPNNLASALQQDATPSVSQQQSANNSSEAEKPTSTKPRKIYTNDDLKGSGGNDNFGGAMPPGLDHINDCNTMCFDQIKAFSQVNTNTNPNWRHDALDAVELVRNDGEWQRYLRDFYNAQYRLCMLNYDRNKDMARNADPPNVTPQEIAVAEKYDVKLKEVQTELQVLRVRGAATQRKFMTNRMAYQFAMLQTSWVASVYFYRVQYMVPR